MKPSLTGLWARHVVRPVRFGLASLAMLAFAVSGRSQQSNIAGSVMDAATGRYLEGAEVIIAGTALHTATERDGSFTLYGVPPGAHDLMVTYPGVDPVSISVRSIEGQTVRIPVQVTSQVVKLAAFTVTGAKEGMSQAIALQKVAINTKIIAAGDQYGDIAEGNAAEYLKFLPGVGVDYNANDARAITLRGMNTAFTNVSLDGNPLASASSGNLNRRFEFEQVAINNVETVEVYKTLTPELPGTSTGGTVNMVTKSAFDREGSLITYRAYVQAAGTDLYLHKSEGWGQERTRKILPGFDMNFAARVGQNVGVNLNYKNSQLYNDYPRSQYTWEYNPANGGLPTNPALTSWNLQNEQKDTRRQSLSGKIDYRFGPHTKAALVGQWAFYDLLFTDRTTTVNTGNLAPLASTSAPAYGNGTVNGLPGRGSVTFGTINRWKSGVTWDGAINFEHEFPNGAKLNASPYWSQAYSKYRDSTGSWYSDAVMQRTGLTVSFDNVGKVAPSYRVTDSAGATVNLNDASLFSLSQLRSRPQTGVDTRSGIAIDYKSANLPLGIPLTVKVGTRFDYTGRNIENHVFNRTAFTPTITGQTLANVIDTGFSNHPIGYGLPAYNFVNPYTAYATFGGVGILPWTPANDTVARFDDDTKAGYLRLDFTPLTNVVIAGGFRYEDRNTDSINRQPVVNNVIQAPIAAKFTDKRWYPSVNVKYTPRPNVVFRLGAANSIGLPDYNVLLPGPPSVTPADIASNVRGRVNIYNPKLQPYKVANFDAGVEYYFSRSGVVQFSVFRKDFKNYIVTATQTLTNDIATELGIDPRSINGAVADYDVTYNFNVPEPGHYTGIEVGYAQNLTFLPKPFNTLGIQINGTIMSIDPIRTNVVFSSTDAALNRAVLQQVQKSMENAAVKQALNVQLNYSIGKFGLNIVSNYTGHVLKSGSGTGVVSGAGAIVQKTVRFSDRTVNDYYNEIQYQAPRNVVDVRMDYKWNKRYTPYFQVRNILKRPIIIATPMLPFNHAEYGDPIYELGVRGAW
jgi:iron complex outermembrane recepter protein